MSADLVPFQVNSFGLADEIPRGHCFVELTLLLRIRQSQRVIGGHPASDVLRFLVDGAGRLRAQVERADLRSKSMPFVIGNGGRGNSSRVAGMSSVDTAEVPSTGDAAPIVSQVPTLGLLSSILVRARARQWLPTVVFRRCPPGPAVNFLFTAESTSALRCVQ